jgi:surfeit locus 1 family protein
MLVVLLYLGVWQVQRHYWKADLLEKLQTRSESTPVMLTPDMIVSGDGMEKSLQDLEFQRVQITGRFQHDKELYLLNRSLNGNPGLHVLTPLVRTDGGVVMINRGWAPFEKRDPSTRLKGQLEGEVKVEGILRLMKGRSSFTLDNEPAKNTWFYWDAAEMAAATGVESLPVYYVMAAKDPAAGVFPVGSQWRLDIRNNHIEYAITWFSLFFALIVIYVVYHRQLPHSDE